MGQEVVVFHSGPGLRPAVISFADRLRAEGHRVHTPDSFDGEVFSSLEEGVRKRDALGIPELIRRAQAAVADLPSGLVLAGFSMGAAAAEFLAANLPGARAAVLMHGALAPADIGAEAWPAGVAVQVHCAEGDPEVDWDSVDALSAAVQASGAPVIVYRYPGAGHLFSDDGLPEYDQAATQLMTRRVLDSLATL